MMFAVIRRVIGRNDWLTDPRMDTPQHRIQVGDEINQGVAQALRSRPTAYWTNCFRENDILYGEVKDYDQFQEDEQVRHLGLVQTLSQPGWARCRSWACWRVRAAAGVAGEARARGGRGYAGGAPMSWTIAGRHRRAGAGRIIQLAAPGRRGVLRERKP